MIKSIINFLNNWGLESPETFRDHFGWHNSLCIFKTKASRGKFSVRLYVYSQTRNTYNNESKTNATLTTHSPFSRFNRHLDPFVCRFQSLLVILLRKKLIGIPEVEEYYADALENAWDEVWEWANHAQNARPRRADSRVAWFSDGPGRSRSRTLSLPRLMDFIQGHVRDVMTPFFFPPIRSNVTYSQKSGILENRA